jgi:hypothetical protein
MLDRLPPELIVHISHWLYDLKDLFYFTNICKGFKDDLVANHTVTRIALTAPNTDERFWKVKATARWPKAIRIPFRTWREYLYTFTGTRFIQHFGRNSISDISDFLQKVRASADMAEIKKSYKRIALQHFPDKIDPKFDFSVFSNGR